MQRDRELKAAVYNGYGESLGTGEKHGDENGPQEPAKPSPTSPFILVTC